jgi:hypothetical protein
MNPTKAQMKYAKNTTAKTNDPPAQIPAFPEGQRSGFAALSQA